MSSPTEEAVQRVLVTCRENVDLLAESLNQCFQTQWRLTFDEQETAVNDCPEWDGPGLVISLAALDVALLWVLPATLSLPGWIGHPGPVEKSRLETLVVDWSVHSVPGDMNAESYAANPVSHLGSTIEECEPTAEAVLLGATVWKRVGGSEVPAGKLWLICPVGNIPASHEKDDEYPELQPEPPPRSAPVVPMQESQYEPVHYPGASDYQDPNRLNRLLKLPVPIIVKLAEKKIELGQLLAIGPGAIVTFEKSCEDLLDLYVNNRLYCRGEAVKIGEKFGLKINEVGSVEERVSALLGPTR